ncbi:hypothetical protein HJG60_009195 [Phyllostomus discolor]|uniref:Uncharacterized protein n=1 Tax=Phyllostomus discolor TaxID=89673 RepID=A0A834DF43_9CHIR|nr:hypothetical protein HJG60_009195 [Phyllostomus discolor]
MIWCDLWPGSLFGLSYSTKFHSSGMYVPLPIMTKNLGGKMKTSRNPLKFPESGHTQGQPIHPCQQSHTRYIRGEAGGFVHSQRFSSAGVFPIIFMKRLVSSLCVHLLCSVRYPRLAGSLRKTPTNL